MDPNDRGGAWKAFKERRRQPQSDVKTKTVAKAPMAVGSSDDTREMATTAAQNRRTAEKLKARINSKELSAGNVELAAILGYGPAQLALGREKGRGMNVMELINFILSDPNVKINISVG